MNRRPDLPNQSIVDIYQAELDRLNLNDEGKVSVENHWIHRMETRLKAMKAA